MTEEDIANLVTLYKKDHSKKEWLALRWARDWAVLRGKAPTGKNAQAFAQAYTVQEQAYITKICRMMKMANYASNLLFAIPYLEGKSHIPAKGLLGRFSGPVEGALTQAVLFARCRTAQVATATADTCAGILGLNRCAA